MNAPTYNKIENNMMETAKKHSEIITWSAEFGELNYDKNVEILKRLYNNKNPERKDYDENTFIRFTAKLTQVN